MKKIFRAEKMIARIKAEGRGDLLDADTLAFIHLLDGKVGDSYNWQSVVHDEELVWIPKDDDQEGAYVALCDCD